MLNKHTHSFRNCKKSFNQNQNYTPAITYYELLELEKEKTESQSVKVKIKRNFPIAPDGFIPNSVVRKFFRIFDEKVPEKKVWKLKWRSSEEKSQSSIVENETEKDFNYEISSEEEEIEKASNKDEKDLDTILKEFFNRLKIYNWFKPNLDLNINSLIKFLVNKLIERNPSNHSDIASLLLEIRSKFKLNKEQLHWIQSQLEEELDATDLDILADNIKLLPSFCSENFTIDSQLMNIIESSSYPDNVKFAAFESLAAITKLENQEVQFALNYVKKLTNPKYKKLNRFRLSKFIEEIEIENQLELERKNRIYYVEDETNSEIFKQLQREDWIPQSVKDDLKTLKDYLEYLLKSLRTVKSKIFYEKLCNYLKSLFDEFKLINTDWEIEIVNGLINNNMDAKAPDQLRNIDMENLDKYLSVTQNKQIHENILTELLRSATFEINRKQTKSTANSILERFLSPKDLSELIEFCSTKNFILPWSDALAYYKSKPDITIDELKDLNGSDVLIREVKSAIRLRSASKLKAKSKSKEKSTKKNKENSDEKSEKKKKKVRKEAKESEKKLKEPTILKEKTFSKQTNSTRTKTKNIDEREKVEQSSIRPQKDDIESVIRVSKKKAKSPTEETKKNEHRRINKLKDDLSNDENIRPSRDMLKRSLSNLLPTNKKTWDLYRKQNWNEDKIFKNDRLINRKIEDNKQLDLLDITKFNDEVKTTDPMKINENNKIYDENNDEIKLEKSFSTFSIDKIENVDQLIGDENERENRFDEFEEDYEEEDEGSDNQEYEYKTVKMFSSDTEKLGQISPKDFNFKLSYRSDSNDQILAEHKRGKESTDQIMAEHKRAKKSKEILAGITKRVVMVDKEHLKKLSKDFIRKYNSIDTSNDEKGHIIEPVDLKSNYENYKFRKSNQNKKIRDIEYNQLLECLIIRGLDLHKHYEKLLPQSSFLKQESFVPIPYFNDFLVVHSYNSKMSLRQNTNLERNSSKIPLTPANSNLDSLKTKLTETVPNNIYPVRQIHNRHLRKQNNYGRNTAKISDLELNHLFLINKLLISYDAQNLNHFYRTINTSLKNYLNNLHSRIPQRIVPLIWNDPVMQKLAMVVSSSRKFKQKRKRTPKSQINGVNFNETKLDLKKSLNTNNKQFNEKKANQFRPNFNQYSKQDLQKSALNSWPIFKSDDTVQNRVLKRRIYHQLLNMKHDYMKLQWRHMLSANRSYGMQRQSNRLFLPPLSVKANIYYPPGSI